MVGGFFFRNATADFAGQRDRMLTAATSPPRLLTLVLLTALSILSLNMFLPSLPGIASDLGADYALVSLSIAGYLAITALLQLIMGPLSDRFGRRPVLLVGLAIFILASLVCALATDIWTFLAFRVLQGAIISGAALSRAVIRDMVPAREAASLMGYVAMAMAIAPMLGPMLGGALDELFGWRASFFTFFALGLAVFALCWADLGETNTSPSETFLEQFRTYPELLGSRRFWGYSLCMAFSAGAFFSFLAGAPLVAETLFAMSPTMLGVALGTITAGFMLGSFLSGRLAGRYALATMMIAGRLVACAGLLAGLLLFLAGFVHVVTLFGATVFVGIGNGLTMPSSNAGALSVRPQLAGSASGLSGALTVAGGAALTSLTGAIISPQNGAFTLLAMMLFASFMALMAALYVAWLDLREGKPDP
jgi:MFS transporter, DHA1 family, multidrug resistance protein